MDQLSEDIKKEETCSVCREPIASDEERHPLSQRKYLCGNCYRACGFGDHTATNCLSVEDVLYIKELKTTYPEETPLALQPDSELGVYAVKGDNNGVENIKVITDEEDNLAVSAASESRKDQGLEMVFGEAEESEPISEVSVSQQDDSTHIVEAPGSQGEESVRITEAVSSQNEEFRKITEAAISQQGESEEIPVPVPSYPEKQGRLSGLKT
ncbi:MAG: hypothetical protein Q4C00_06285, partial [Bacillota bacterium]|nr:hypothetical protein [Bacillota bacterium]